MQYARSASSHESNEDICLTLCEKGITIEPNEERTEMNRSVTRATQTNSKCES